MSTEPGTASRPRPRPAREPLLVTLLLAALFVIAHAHALPPWVLAAADLAGFAQPLARERTAPARPANPAQWDEALQFAPWFAFDAREVARGKLPLWNPHSGCGAPHAANDQVELFYPPRLLALLLGPALGLFLLALAKHVGAGLGLHLFLRARGFGVWGALAGAVAFAFGGFLVVWQGWPHAAAAATLGWLLLAVERSARRPGLLPSKLAAVATAFALLAGHAETALHVGLAALVWAIVRAIELARASGPRAALALGARLAGGVVLGVLLAAPHVLLFADELRESEAFAHRAAHGVELAVPARFLALVPFPELYGDPRDGTFPVSPVCSFLELAGWSVGGAAVALALAGALGDRGERRTRTALAALGIAAIAAGFVLALPGFAALSRIPPLSLARNQRLELVALAAFAIAAAAGVESAVARRARARDAAIAFAAIVGLALLARRAFPPEVLGDADALGRAFRGGTLALLGPSLAAAAALAVVASSRLGGLGPRATGALLVLTLALEQVVIFAGGWNAAVPREAFFPASPTIAALGAAPAGDRARALVLGDFLVLPPDEATAYGLDVVGRYDALGSRTFAPLRDALGPVPGPETPECFRRIDPRIARVLGVRRILVGWPELDPRLAWTELAPAPARPPFAFTRPLTSQASVGERFRAPGVDATALLLSARLVGARAATLELQLRAPGSSDVVRRATATLAPGRGEVVPVLFRFDPLATDGRELTASIRRTDGGSGDVLLASTEGAPGAVRLEDGRDLAGRSLVLSVAATSALAADYREVPGLACEVVEDTRALPRARVVGVAVVVSSVDAGIARLRSSEHEPRTTVVLDTTEVDRREAARPVGSATIESYEPDAVVVKATSPAGGWLVLADAWAPGWRASVDGKPAAVLHADVALRAVALPAGAHTVAFRYEPRALTPGVALAALALAFLAAIAVAERIDARRPAA